nr:hypothetical protein [Actinomycetota bacterium]
GGEAAVAIQRLVDEALDMRREMHTIDTIRPADVERKHKLHRESETRLEILGAVADVLAGAALTTAGERDPATALTARIEADAPLIVDLLDALESRRETAQLSAVRSHAALRLDAGRPEMAPERRPLHWPVTFPEVFSGRGNFDAMIGNPPFVTGTSIKAASGGDVLKFLAVWQANGETAGGRADLVAYFFLAARRVCSRLGFLATNSIAQGDSAEVGLRPLFESGWQIYRGVSSARWPGSDTVQISKIWAAVGSPSIPIDLDGVLVSGIDEYLYPEPRSGWRKRGLKASAGLCVSGSKLDAKGFIISADVAASLLASDPSNSDVVTRLINGDELNESSTRLSARWTINFLDRDEAGASRYEEPFEYLRSRLPEEIGKKGTSYAGWTKWWQYWRHRADLYRTIWDFEEVLAIAGTSKALVPVYAPARQTFTHACYVFTRNDLDIAGALWSSHHWRWAVRHASSMREDPRYAGSDVFDTFPLPPPDDGTVSAAAAELNVLRQSRMEAAGVGIRDVCNAVHDPSESGDDIPALRRAQVALDGAIQDAYGWDFDLAHGFFEMRGQAGVRFSLDPQSASEVLERLLELNRERYYAEVAAGLHNPTKAAARVATNQCSLLDEEDE